jgi:hypothetical protein
MAWPQTPFKSIAYPAQNADSRLLLNVHALNSLQNTQHDQCIFATVPEVGRPPCSRTPFQQFINDNKQLLELPHFSYSTGLTSDLLET